MNKQELEQFVKWLPSNVEEFKDKSPEEIVVILNKMSQTEEGIETISKFINQFKQNSTNMFRKGGKLDQLVKKFQNGGETPKRKTIKWDLVGSIGKGKDERYVEQFTYPDGDIKQIIRTKADKDGRINLGSWGEITRLITNNKADTIYQGPEPFAKFIKSGPIDNSISNWKGSSYTHYYPWQNKDKIRQRLKEERAKIIEEFNKVKWF